MAKCVGWGQEYEFLGNYPSLSFLQIYYTRLASEAERSRRQIHPKSHLHREQRELLIEGDVTSVVVGGLRPWSKYQFAVAVRNGRSEGPLSETLEFTTPEGGKNHSC